jgi:small subunit ribosomal protein S2
MPYVTERWLGGTLTNFRTIRDRLKRLEELERIMESGEIKNYSKKMESQLTREQKKIFRNLNGIRTMHRLPGAIIVVDTNREKNALLEAKNLGIPTICLIDTDGDPELADIPIPGNDDSMRSIDVIIRELCSAVSEGLGHRQTSDAVANKRDGRDGGDGDGDGQQRRRSSRSRFRADGAGEAAPAEPTAATE